LKITKLAPVFTGITEVFELLSVKLGNNYDLQFISTPVEPKGAELYTSQPLS